MVARRHESALHQHLRAADLEQLLDLRPDLLAGQDVRLGIARLAVEVAENALGRTDVGVVDVAVDDVRAIRLGVQGVGTGQRAATQLVNRQLVVHGERVGVRQTSGSGPGTRARTHAVKPAPIRGSSAGQLI